MTRDTNTGVEFCEAVVHFMDRLMADRDFAGAARYYESNRDLVDAAGGKWAAMMLHQAARAYASLADYQSSLKLARIAQSRAAKEGDNLLLAEIFLTLAGALRDLGEAKEAERAFRDAESIFRRNDCLEGQSRALNLLAGLFYRQHEHKNALSALMDAITIARRLGDRKKLAFMLGNIGRIHTFIGNLADAKKHLKLNLDLSRELGDAAEEARAGIALGYVLLQEGEYQEAEALLTSSLRQVRALSNRRNEAICLSYLGELHYRTNSLPEAEDALRSALDIAGEFGSTTSLTGRIMRHLAQVKMMSGQKVQARRMASKAMTVAREIGDKVEIGAALKIKAGLAALDGRDDEARQLFVEALSTLDEAGVRLEKADAQVAAGRSGLFSTRQSMTYLFRAEELFSRNKVSGRLREIEKEISEIESRQTPRAGTKGAVNIEGGVDFITACPEIATFKDQLAAIGRADLPVLLTGETGVGKDHLARYFHSIVRPSTPYVAINCASVPGTLLESELFGYHRGAFTGADSQKKGLLLAANGGVLLLDEIGDMPIDLQTKLLGVLESRTVTPLGSIHEVEFDVKLVAATNKDLETMVEAGSFRRDLYYRLSGMTFHMPPLRERKEDVPLLLKHFMNRNGLLEGNQPVPEEILRRFVEYDWPGNTRELANKVKRLEVMKDMVADGDLVELSNAVFGADMPEQAGSLFDRVEQFERQLLLEALVTAGGNKSAAARILGIHEATVRTKLKRYGISLPMEMPS